MQKNKTLLSAAWSDGRAERGLKHIGCDHNITWSRFNSYPCPTPYCYLR